MNEYVDVRGPHPVYVNGLYAITLEGYDRNISLEEAREAAKKLSPIVVVPARPE